MHRGFKPLRIILLIFKSSPIIFIILNLTCPASNKNYLKQIIFQNTLCNNSGSQGLVTESRLGRAFGDGGRDRGRGRVVPSS